MKGLSRAVVFAVSMVAIWGFGCLAGGAYANGEGVLVKYEDWTDAERQRTMPIKLYLPENLKAPAPVAIFSHGLGGSREAAPYLGNYWAQHGYIGVFIQHPGSDESFWKPTIDRNNLPNRQQLMGRFRQQVADPQHARNRAEDVHFIIDQLERINASDPLLKGKLNLKEIAIAGHSYGSWTALTASGQRFMAPGGRGISAGDPRIKAAIYLSPTPPRKGAEPAEVFGEIKIPGLHFTGTLDDSPVNNTHAADRRIAFDNISKSDQFLVILKDADHAVFGGRQRKELDNVQHKIIEETTTAFLDAYLRNDSKSKDWLLKSASSYIKPHGTYELKVAKN